MRADLAILSYDVSQFFEDNMQTLNEEQWNKEQTDTKIAEQDASFQEDIAKDQEDAAKALEDAAKDQEDAAKALEDAAKALEDAAKALEDASKIKEDSAKDQELIDAKTKEQIDSRTRRQIDIQAFINSYLTVEKNDVVTFEQYAKLIRIRDRKEATIKRAEDIKLKEINEAIERFISGV